MSTPLNAPKQCPNCGKPVPASAPGGICPACLMAQGAETDGAVQRPRFEPPPLDTVAALFPKLEILALLGAGGMGAVYKARQPDLDRFIALKLLPKDGKEEGASAERFNREARALARLSHPNIVAVHEFGQVEGLHFFIMEFVDGANLRQMELTGRLSAREALQIIPQICDALQYAHDEGVVHRDIKPENVLVDRKGRVKIADFGLAKIMGVDAEALRLTVDGQVMGTPHYMAPEQVERPLAVDHRADIYSLGVVFYEMLTGDLPIGKFAPPSRKVELDVRLDEIVLRALENDPERRYQHASEVKTRVANVADTPGAAVRPGEEPPSPSGEKQLRWAGIPVVVERDGEREVSFNGALGVLASVLAVVAAGMFAVHLVSGQEHVLPRFCYFIAGWTVFLAIRSTLRRKRPALVRADNGTVLLVQPTQRHPYLWHQASLVAVFALVMGSHFLKTGIINSRMLNRSSAVPDTVTAKPGPDSDGMVAFLPTGGSVRLLGISDPDSTTNGWWKADGDPIQSHTFRVRDWGQSLKPDEKSKVFLLDFSEAPPSSVFTVEFDGSRLDQSGGGAQEVAKDGKWLVGDIRHYRASFPSDRRTTSIRIGLGILPWRRVQTLKAPNWNPEPSWPRRAGEPAWKVKFHSGPTDTAAGAQVNYLFGPVDDDWEHRVVLIDTNGTEHLYQIGSGSSFDTNNVQMWTRTFRELLATAITEVRLDVRPLQKVVFPEVALEPKRPLPKRLPLRFAPDESLALDGLIDLDSARTGDLPHAGPDSNPLAGLGENILWAQQEGFDALAGASGLEMLNVECAILREKDWDMLTPHQVMDRVYSGMFAPKVLKPEPTSRTFAYRTREGGHGLLRFDSDPDGGPIHLTIKRVIR